MQLKSGEKQDKHHTDVEEAEFVLEYNKSFIENDKLTEVERYLECRMSGENYAVIQRLEDYRQDMVNYLVYLEGLATCIHSEILTFERIDNLFAYRFFIAMNHIDPQVIGLLPFAPYYRGCFQLYEKWLAYRISCKKYSKKDDWGLPLFSTALCNHYGYEKYACPEMMLTKELEGYTLSFKAELSKNEHLNLRLNLRERNRVKISYSNNVYKDSPVYYSLLRRILKELVYAETSGVLKIRGLPENHSFDMITGDSDVVKMFKAIKYTKAIRIAREQSKWGDCRFRQLEADGNLSEENLEEISALIYNTDETKHIFENQSDPIKYLKNLFKHSNDKVFRRENLFVYCAGECVMGIILWCKGTLSRLINGTDTPNVSQVSDRFEDKTSGNIWGLDPNGTGIVILDLSLAPQVRRMGIASIMLKEFLGQHANICIEVCISSMNTRAIKLFANNGFQIEVEEKPYSEKELSKRVVMRRNKREEGSPWIPILH